MTDKPPPAEDALLGVTIAGRYRVISRLGEGGMGVTYRAWDEREGRPVVLKMPRRELFENAAFAERFGREVRMMAALAHPSIVPILDMGEDDGLPFLAMRFLPGGSLSNRRLRDAEGKPLPMQPSTLQLWLPAIASALDFVHASGIVHRDVKPANIFFDAFWGAYLGDFGIAKIVADTTALEKEHTLTATSIAVGTQQYMAPEQFGPKARVDGRADQYALAVMAYELLAGRRPFRGDTAHLIVEVTTQPVPPLTEVRRDLPKSLCRAVYRGLSKTPGERFATCSQFATSLLQDVGPLGDEEGVARLLCPSCGNMLKMPTAAAGRQGKCPRCKDKMMVARDLGALWLVREEHEQDEWVEPPDIPGDSTEVFSSLEDTAPGPWARVQGIWSALDPTVQRSVIGATLLASLVASVLMTGIYATNEARRDISALTATKNQLLAENERLKQALKAMAIQQASAAEPQAAAQPPQPQVPAVPPDPGTLSQFKGSIGMTLSFQVTGANNGRTVWGSNPYTADSALARAAVHAGVLQIGETGVVNVTILGGQQSYVSTERNGVKTNSWGSYPLSYWIEGTAVVQPAAPQPVTQQSGTDQPFASRSPTVSPAPGTLSQFQDSIGKTLPFLVVGTANGGTVWGSNPYTADSHLARAAVHAGAVRAGEAGVVNVTILPGQQSYVGTTKNGVKTSSWGQFPLSYRIEKAPAKSQ